MFPKGKNIWRFSEPGNQMLGKFPPENLKGGGGYRTNVHLTFANKFSGHQIRQRGCPQTKIFSQEKNETNSCLQECFHTQRHKKCNLKIEIKWKNKGFNFGTKDKTNCYLCNKR